MQKDSRSSLLKKIYGQNIGMVQNSKPIMIENPEFLKLTQNGDDSSGGAETEEIKINGSSGKVRSYLHCVVRALICSNVPQFPGDQQYCTPRPHGQTAGNDD